MNQSDTITTGAFLENLRSHADKPLIFRYGGKRIGTGYHVTEVKAASFQALDCGGNPEAWNETVVQLWDVPGTEGDSFVRVSKFLSILDQVAARVTLDAGAKLVFECGDAFSPAVHYTADGFTEEDGAVVADLTPVHASCKPRDRWLASLGVSENTLTTADACCAPGAAPETLAVSSSTCCS